MMMMMLMMMLMIVMMRGGLCLKNLLPLNKKASKADRRGVSGGFTLYNRSKD